MQTAILEFFAPFISWISGINKGARHAIKEIPQKKTAIMGVFMSKIKQTNVKNRVEKVLIAAIFRNIVRLFRNILLIDASIGPAIA